MGTPPDNKSPQTGAGSGSTPTIADTRAKAYACIQNAAPGAVFDDSSILDNIPVNGDDVGMCLNNRIPLVGNQRWKAGDIKGTWTVAILIAKTDYRRNH